MLRSIELWSDTLYGDSSAISSPFWEDWITRKSGKMIYATSKGHLHHIERSIRDARGHSSYSLVTPVSDQQTPGSSGWTRSKMVILHPVKPSPNSFYLLQWPLGHQCGWSSFVVSPGKRNLAKHPKRGWDVASRGHPVFPLEAKIGTGCQSQYAVGMSHPQFSPICLRDGNTPPSHLIELRKTSWYWEIRYLTLWEKGEKSQRTADILYIDAEQRRDCFVPWANALTIGY